MPDGTLFCPNVTPEGFFSSLSVHTQLRSAQIKTWFGHSFSRYYLQLYLMWYRQGLSQWRALWIGNVALLNKTYFELWIQSLTPAFSFYAVFVWLLHRLAFVQRARFFCRLKRKCSTLRHIQLLNQSTWIYQFAVLSVPVLRHSTSLLLHNQSAEFSRVVASLLLLLAVRSHCVSLWQQTAGWDSVFQVVCRRERVTGRAKQAVSRGRGITDSYADTSRITGYINSVH